MDSSKKIYYGVLLKKTQLENTQGQAKKTFPFSTYFLCLSTSFSFISASSKAGNTAEWQNKREKVKPCLSKRSVQVHNQPNQLYAY